MSRLAALVCAPLVAACARAPIDATKTSDHPLGPPGRIVYERFDAANRDPLREAVAYGVVWGDGSGARDVLSKVRGCRASSIHVDATGRIALKARDHDGPRQVLALDSRQLRPPPDACSALDAIADEGAWIDGTFGRLLVWGHCCYQDVIARDAWVTDARGERTRITPYGRVAAFIDDHHALVHTLDASPAVQIATLDGEPPRTVATPPHTRVTACVSSTRSPALRARRTGRRPSRPRAGSPPRPPIPRCGLPCFARPGARTSACASSSSGR
jgi:hypothetical protein